MNKKSKIIGMAFSFLLISSSIQTQAATRDFVNIKTGVVTPVTSWQSDTTVFNDLITKLSDDATSADYAIEFGKKYYSYNGLLNALISKPQGQTTAEAFVSALSNTSLVVTVTTQPTEEEFGVLDIN